MQREELIVMGGVDAASLERTDTTRCELAGVGAYGVHLMQHM